eukprot:sb/3460977/
MVVTPKPAAATRPATVAPKPTSAPPPDPFQFPSRRPWLPPQPTEPPAEATGDLVRSFLEKFGCGRLKECVGLLQPYLKTSLTKEDLVSKPDIILSSLHRNDRFPLVQTIRNILKLWCAIGIQSLRTIDVPHYEKEYGPLHELIGTGLKSDKVFFRPSIKLLISIFRFLLIPLLPSYIVFDNPASHPNKISDKRLEEKFRRMYTRVAGTTEKYFSLSPSFHHPNLFYNHLTGEIVADHEWNRILKECNEKIKAADLVVVDEVPSEMLAPPPPPEGVMVVGKNLDTIPPPPPRVSHPLLGKPPGAVSHPLLSKPPHQPPPVVSHPLLSKPPQSINQPRPVMAPPVIPVSQGWTVQPSLTDMDRLLEFLARNQFKHDKLVTEINRYTNNFITLQCLLERPESVLCPTNRNLSPLSNAVVIIILELLCEVAPRRSNQHVLVLGECSRFIGEHIVTNNPVFRPTLNLGVQILNFLMDGVSELTVPSPLQEDTRFDRLLPAVRLRGTLPTFNLSDYRDILPASSYIRLTRESDTPKQAAPSGGLEAGEVVMEVTEVGGSDPHVVPCNLVIWNSKEFKKLSYNEFLTTLVDKMTSVKWRGKSQERRGKSQERRGKSPERGKKRKAPAEQVVDLFEEQTRYKIPKKKKPAAPLAKIATIPATPMVVTPKPAAATRPATVAPKPTSAPPPDPFQFPSRRPWLPPQPTEPPAEAAGDLVKSFLEKFGCGRLKECVGLLQPYLNTSLTKEDLVSKPDIILSSLHRNDRLPLVQTIRNILKLWCAIGIQSLRTIDVPHYEKEYGPLHELIGTGLKSDKVFFRPSIKLLISIFRFLLIPLLPSYIVFDNPASHPNKISDKRLEEKFRRMYTRVAGTTEKYFSLSPSFYHPNLFYNHLTGEIVADHEWNRILKECNEKIKAADLVVVDEVPSEMLAPPPPPEGVMVVGTNLDTQPPPPGVSHPLLGKPPGAVSHPLLSKPPHQPPPVVSHPLLSKPPQSINQPRPVMAPPVIPVSQGWTVQPSLTDMDRLLEFLARNQFKHDKLVTEINRYTNNFITLQCLLERPESVLCPTNRNLSPLSNAVVIIILELLCEVAPRRSNQHVLVLGECSRFIGEHIVTNNPVFRPTLNLGVQILNFLMDGVSELTVPSPLQEDTRFDRLLPAVRLRGTLPTFNLSDYRDILPASSYIRLTRESDTPKQAAPSGGLEAGEVVMEVTEVGGSDPHVVPCNLVIWNSKEFKKLSYNEFLTTLVDKMTSVKWFCLQIARSAGDLIYKKKGLNKTSVGVGGVISRGVSEVCDVMDQSSKTVRSGRFTTFGGQQFLQSELSVWVKKSLFIYKIFALFECPTLFLSLQLQRGGLSTCLNRKVTTNQNSLFRSRDWLSANQGPVFPDSVGSRFYPFYHII